MVYNRLIELEVNNKLYSSSIVIADREAIGGKRFVFGREIIGFDRARIRTRGGESGYEEVSVPLGKILEIVSEGRAVFRRKPSIKKVYPR